MEKALIVTDSLGLAKIRESHPEVRVYGLREWDEGGNDLQIENRRVCVNNPGSVLVTNFEPDWEVEYPDGLKLIPSLYGYIEKGKGFSAFSEGEEEDFLREIA